MEHRDIEYFFCIEAGYERKLLFQKDKARSTSFSLFSRTLHKHEHEQDISTFMLSFVEAGCPPTALYRGTSPLPLPTIVYLALSKARISIDLQDPIPYPPSYNVRGTRQKKWRPRGFLVRVASHDFVFQEAVARAVRREYNHHSPVIRLFEQISKR